MFRRISILTVTLGLISGPVFAADVLTLHEAIESSLASNPRVRVAERQIAVARAREVQAAAMPNPNLTLMIDQVPIPSLADGNYMAGVSQPLLLAGQREARVELARIETRLAEYERRIILQDLVTRVKDAYAQILFQRAALSEAQTSQEQAQANLKSAQGRYAAGDVARLDVLRAEVEASRAQREVNAMRHQWEQAKAQLNVLLGRNAQAALTLAPIVAPDQRLALLSTLVAEALRQRVELRRAEAAIAREGLQRRLALAGQWTGTEVTGAIGAVAGNPGFSATLTLPMPFYRQQGEIAEAEAQQASAQAERDALRNEITLEVEAAYRDVATATSQVALFKQSYLPQAERLVKNAQRRLEVGEGSRVEVAEALRARRDTRMEYQQAVLKHQQALNQLERAIGQVDKTPVQETQP